MIAYQLQQGGEGNCNREVKVNILGFIERYWEEISQERTVTRLHLGANINYIIWRPFPITGLEAQLRNLSV